MLLGYYVKRQSLDLREEFGPTCSSGVSFIPDIACVNEIRYGWLGRGNEGEGAWRIDKNGDAYVCEIYPKGHNEPILVRSSLAELDKHLYASPEEAAKEL